MIEEAIDNVSIGFSGDRRTDAELVAAEIAERRGLNIDDLDTRQRPAIYGEAYEALTKKKFDPDNMAQGGRVGLRIGSDEGKDVSGREYSAPSAAAKSVKKSPSRDDSPSGGGSNVTVPKKQIPPKAKSTLKDLYNTGQDLNYLRNLMIGNFPGIGKQLLFDLGKRKFFDDQSMLDQEGIINGLPDSNMFADVSAMDLKRKNQFKNLDYGTAKDIGMINPTMTEQEFEGVKSGEITEPTGQFIGAKGGRVGLKDGMDRRTFMKIMAGLASIPVLGKFFKGAKVASKAAPVAEKMVGTST